MWGKYQLDQRIVVLSGSGISVNAGIPDFRSPKTGLYDKLRKSHPQLARPQDLFDIDFFIGNPRPFYEFSSQISAHTRHPTPAHFFIRLLELKGRLHHHFTQNIDRLDVKAGLSEEKVMAAHGSSHLALCSNRMCKKEVPVDIYRKHLRAKTVLRCQKCNFPIKSGVVFFGEPLPHNFQKEAEKMKQADLVLVMGTSLQVAPFNLLVKMAPRQTPKILINKQNTAAYDFTLQQRKRLFLESDCDEGVRELSKWGGWVDELNQLITNYQSEKQEERSK